MYYSENDKFDIIVFFNIFSILLNTNNFLKAMMHILFKTIQTIVYLCVQLNDKNVYT